MTERQLMLCFVVLKLQISLVLKIFVFIMPLIVMPLQRKSFEVLFLKLFLGLVSNDYMKTILVLYQSH